MFSEPSTCDKIIAVYKPIQRPQLFQSKNFLRTTFLTFSSTNFPRKMYRWRHAPLWQQSATVHCKQCDLFDVLFARSNTIRRMKCLATYANGSAHARSQWNDRLQSKLIGSTMWHILHSAKRPATLPTNANYSIAPNIPAILSTLQSLDHHGSSAGISGIQRHSLEHGNSMFILQKVAEIAAYNDALATSDHFISSETKLSDSFSASGLCSDNSIFRIIFRIIARYSFSSRDVSIRRMQIKNRNIDQPELYIANKLPSDCIWTNYCILSDSSGFASNEVAS